jgi:hypothetical protein
MKNHQLCSSAEKNAMEHDRQVKAGSDNTGSDIVQQK